MSPKTLVNFFLKKIGLNKLLFKFARSEIVNTDGDSAKDALKRLEALSPFPSDSSACLNNVVGPSNEVDIQIIVPCYNVQRYVLDCLKSIHPRHSFIVSVVNDGSTDETPSLIAKFCESSNFEIINKTNGGLSSARNAAMLPKIKGKYVTFIDSDDYIDSQVLDSMLDIALKNDFDIVQGDTACINALGKKTGKLITKHGEISRFELTGVAWGKIIKSSIFNGVLFPEGFYYEDTVMSLVLYQNVKKIFGYEGFLYFYRNSPGSITHQFYNAKNIDTLYVVLSLFEKRKELGLKIDEYSYSRFINQSSFLYSRLKRLGHSVVRDSFIVYSNFIKNNFIDKRFNLHTNKLKKLEYSLLNSDFGKFVAAAKYL